MPAATGSHKRSPMLHLLVFQAVSACRDVSPSVRILLSSTLVTTAVLSTRTRTRTTRQPLRHGEAAATPQPTHVWLKLPDVDFYNELFLLERFLPAELFGVMESGLWTCGGWKWWPAPRCSFGVPYSAYGLQGEAVGRQIRTRNKTQES